jgi:hypothetical protein
MHIVCQGLKIAIYCGGELKKIFYCKKSIREAYLYPIAIPGQHNKSFGVPAGIKERIPVGVLRVVYVNAPRL